MTAEEVLRQYRDAPVGESIGPLTRSLASRTVYVAAEEAPSAQSTEMRFKVATDNSGGLWLYAYTSEAEFSKALPQGSMFAAMSFPDVFEIVEADSRFAGIYLNSASDDFYPIPRELFEFVKQELPRPNE